MGDLDTERIARLEAQVSNLIEELARVRERIHRHSSFIQANTNYIEAMKGHEDRLKALETALSRAMGMAIVVRILWAIVALFAGALIAKVAGI